MPQLGGSGGGKVLFSEGESVLKQWEEMHRPPAPGQVDHDNDDKTDDNDNNNGIDDDNNGVDHNNDDNDDDDDILNNDDKGDNGDPLGKQNEHTPL